MTHSNQVLAAVFLVLVVSITFLASVELHWLAPEPSACWQPLLDPNGNVTRLK